jgi:hypothetical protein
MIFFILFIWQIIFVGLTFTKKIRLKPILMPLMIEKKELKRITSAENARNEMQNLLTTNVVLLQEAR